ncbi:PAS domain S-box protein [Guptibacillus algicola]|uniref:PAS domain S-box protein n=1 Tax=Guptibacillus algicola TaxID=225844 RepID=UPI001CD497CE|nr:PAS domain S-box protein [Alkalihalobacillus algicola]MCA0986513.1 PAS domain S-box protein [Alkalihalobacillus algicola]
MDNPIFICNLEGEIQHASYLVKRILQMGDHTKGYSIYEFVHPDDRPGIEGCFSELLTLGDQGSIPFRYRIENDNYEFLYAKASLVNTHEYPEPVVYITNFYTSDGVELFPVYDSYDNLKRKYQLLFENNCDATFVIDLNGRFLSVNDACVTLSGYSKLELIRMTFFQLIKETYHTSAKKELIRLTNDPDKQNNTFIEMENKSGETVLLNVTSIPLIENGNTTGIYVIAKDVTRQTRLTEELMQSQETLHAVLEHLNVGVFLYAVKDDMTLSPFFEVNHIVCNTLGYSKSELMSMTLRDLYTPEMFQIVLNQRSRLLTSKNMTLKSYHLHKNQKKIPAKINSQIITVNGETMVFSMVEYQTNSAKIQAEEHRSRDPGKNLRLIMAEMDINTAELAAITNLSQATISNLRTGKVKKPNVDTAKKISSALNESASRIWPDLPY